LPVKISVVAAPVLLFLYGILRLMDGLDGTHGPGPAWNAGHVMFFLAFVFLAVLIIGLRRLVPARVLWQRALANIAVVAGVAGSLCFLWVILGDLFRRLHDDVPLPGPLHAAGPLFFQLGLMTLLVQLATSRPCRLPARSPFLVFLGFVPIAVSLDLLPVGAVLILCGLVPLARHSAMRHHRESEPSRP
jgi:hypothetical protein